MKLPFFLIVLLIFFCDVHSQTLDQTYPKDDVETYLKILLSPQADVKIPSTSKNSVFENNLLIIKGLTEIKEGNFWRAYWDLKKSYQSSVKNLKKDSTDVVSKLNACIISIAIKEVPNEYHWLRNFLGFNPLSIELQYQYLNEAKNHNSEIISSQAHITELLMTSFLLKDRDLTYVLAEGVKKKFPNNEYVKVALSWVYIKMHYPQLSLQELKSISEKIEWFGYYNYLLGSAYFYVENYENATIYFNRYLKEYHTDYVKDIYYKKLMISWLQYNKPIEGNPYLDSVIQLGGEYMNLDRYALKFVQEETAPNRSISYARMLFDGGNYEKSIKVLNAIKIDTLNEDDKLEYYYRLGRSNQESKNRNLAIKCYLEVLKFAGEKPKVYYPANAALNLGKLYQELNDKQNAILFYQKALNYPKHPYKNSIDAEAKRRLNTLNASK